MAGNMFLPSQQRQNNPFVNMGMNMLSQMAMAKYAQNMRAEEAQKEREQQMKEYEGKMETQLALSGYQQIPEGAPVEPGAVKVGGKLYKQGEIKPVPIKDGDKLLGYAMNVGGKYEFVKNPKEKDETEDTAAIRTFEAVNFGGPVPEMRGTEKYKKLWEKERESKAIRIGMAEKVETQEAMKDVDRRSFLQTAAWDKQVADVTKTRFDKDQWADMPVWKREEEVFNTANMDMKTVYKDWNPYFGDKDGVQGWYGKNPKTGKFELIKRWGKEKEITVPKTTPSSRGYKF